MMYYLKKIRIIACVVLLFQSLTLAADADAFSVQVSPSSFDINEPVDLTVRATKANGDVVTDYVGDVFIEIQPNTITSDDYTLPSDGLYTFIASDQGVKTFSKGLTIKKAGTYKVVVTDVIKDTAKGEATVIVGGASDTNVSKVEIISPVKGVAEKKSSINVLGKSDLKNSPFEVYINNQRVQQGTTDAEGGFNLFVNNVASGTNSLEVRVVDSSNVVIGKSDIIEFEYSPEADGSFKKLTVTPTGTLKQGANAVFDIQTDETVTSAEMILSNDGGSYPLDKIKDGEFSKQIQMQKDGEFTVSLRITSNGDSRTIDNIGTITVQSDVSVQQVKIFRDETDTTKVKVSWSSIGDIGDVKVLYGTDRDNLDQTMVVTGGNEVVIANLDPSKTYYLKAQPLDASGNDMGTASDLTIIEPSQGSAPMCIVNGINVVMEKIGDRYYLTWDKVSGADKYSIYRAENPTDDIRDMQKVGETSDIRFEYPYDPKAAKDQYAYYAVQANCSDGTALQIDNVKKVKVGPFANMMYILLFTLIVYAMMKLNGYAKH